jgi:deoxyribodipyrimidine photo-lyase
MSDASLLWFRRDLRLADNVALTAAIERDLAIVPVFVWAPEEDGKWPPGSASRWWLHQSLRGLEESLRERGSRLILRRGPTIGTLRRLARETRAVRLYCNRCYEPAAARRDAKVAVALEFEGVEVVICEGALLFEPTTIHTSGGRPYQVFTPFWRAALAGAEPAAPLPAPRRLPSPARWPRTLALDQLQLEPRVDWASGMRASWKPGERGARVRLRHFLANRLVDYPRVRDRPDREGTSRLSPHLHFGEISVRSVWHAVQRHSSGHHTVGLARASEAFLRQLLWREFAHHLLVHFPHTSEHPLRPQFEYFPWVRNHRALRRWQRGQTGYPMVDAGMRELWATGWMHNRVRMIVASFLVKDLRLPWKKGAQWFWDTLVDADLGNNTLGWQWASGCGADAAPFFRIFNPVRQGEKFDADGDYVRRWVPELRRLPARWIHRPWQAPIDVLEHAGVRLGDSYPSPIVDHGEARRQALAGFAQMRERAAVAGQGSGSRSRGPTRSSQARSNRSR